VSRSQPRNPRALPPLRNPSRSPPGTGRSPPGDPAKRARGARTARLEPRAGGAPTSSQRARIITIPTVSSSHPSPSWSACCRGDDARGEEEQKRRPSSPRACYPSRTDRQTTGGAGHVFRHGSGGSISGTPLPVSQPSPCRRRPHEGDDSGLLRVEESSFASCILRLLSGYGLRRRRELRRSHRQLSVR
jgi:hypothetical protein